MTIDLLPHVYDLTAYRQRIGYTGPLEPTLPVLNALASHHVQTIPFENFDVLLNRGIDLAPAAIERKLVTDRRGGYCFEQNGLMLGILRQIGFSVRPLSARVRLGAERWQLPPKTHLFLVVTVEGEEWLFDVGVGSASLSAVIRFATGREQETPHETRRLIHEEGRFYHQALSPTGWIDVYEYSGEEMPVIDREVANWWTSTNPQSKFRRNVMCARAAANGERHGLLNDRLTHRRNGEVISETIIASPEHLLEVLRTVFGVDLPPGTVLTPCSNATP